MRADDGQPGSRLKRTIRHDGEDDPARSRFIDGLLLKRRTEQAEEGAKSFVSKSLGIPDPHV